MINKSKVKINPAQDYLAHSGPALGATVAIFKYWISNYFEISKSPGSQKSECLKVLDNVDNQT